MEPLDLTTTPGYVPGFADTLNLRELGGLPCTDGRHVRHGLIYRGSALADLTDAERARVDSLGLSYLLDLRAAGEASGAADYVPAGCAYERIGGMRFEDGSEVDFSPESIARWERQDPSVFEDGSFMERLYVSMAFGNPAMHALVDHVADGQVPVYFHCTAGKDRTGMGALMLGLVLGITREAIFEDFLLTNAYRRSIIEGVAERLGPDADPALVERWQKANGVEERALQAVFEAIESRHATVEAYLAEEFGLGAATIAALRDRYTA